MKLKLIRHAFPDDVNWIIVRENVPIGTEYEMLGYESHMGIFNAYTGKHKEVDCYFVKRLDDDSMGYIPTVCLEMIES